MNDFITQYSTWIICILISLIFTFFMYKIFLVYYHLTSKIAHFLNNESEPDENNLLHSLWIDYSNNFISTGFGHKTYIKATEYFNLSSLLEILYKKRYINGLNPALLFSASNLLVGLGIFGTFLGLSFGIKSVELGSSAEIQKGIEGLLSGMGTAFWTSLAGMAFSLILTFFEKRMLGRLTMSLNGLSKKLDRKYLLTQQEINQMQIQALSEMFKQQFSYTEPGVEMQSTGRLMWQIVKQTEATAAATESFVTDLSCDLENRFVTIRDAFGSLADEISKLGDKIQSPASNLMDNVVTEIKKMSGELIKEMKSSISESTNEDLTTISQLLMKSSQGLNELPERLEQMTNNLNETFDELKSSIAEVSKDAVSQSSTSIADMKTVIDNMVQALDAKNKAMQVSQDKLIERHNETTIKTEDLLIQFQQTIGGLDSINNGISGSIDNIIKAQAQTETIYKSFSDFRNTIQELSATMVLLQSDQQKLASKFIDDSVILVSELKDTLEISTRTTQQNSENYRVINEGLQDIFSQIDGGLRQYQKTTRDGIQDFLGIFTAATKETMDSMTQQSSCHMEVVNELTEAVDKMKKIN